MSNQGIHLISICIPVFNEKENIHSLYQALVELTEVENAYDFEFSFSDNASTDGTWGEITKLAEIDSRVRAIRFSKNFGFQNSILANYAEARGAAVVQIDADLQDPPLLISQFLREWEKGVAVAYGVRFERPENFVKRRLRRFGYLIIDLLSETKIPHDAGDFRLLDRKVVDALLSQSHANPYIRGVIPGLGFQQVGIKYSRAERVNGESKFPLRSVFRLGFQGIINHSTMPLRLATYLGAAVLVFSFLTSVYSILAHFMNSDLPPGFTTTQLYLLASIGLNSLFLGIIGEYLLRIYRLLRKEPLVIVDRRIGS